MVLFFERALLPDGWATHVRIDIDATGTITAVEPNASRAGAESIAGSAVPGMVNAHSHAFQRAIAGRTEVRTRDDDDFWSWRDAMYAAVRELSPSTLYARAVATYRLMVAAGYTAVVEFHYLHRDPIGAWYADRAAMGRACIEAARDVGLAITLLPALYAHGDSDGSPLAAEQRRFATSVDDALAIAQLLRDAYRDDPRVTIGVCAHSLRAVTPDELRALIDGSPTDAPIHIHVAETTREVASVEASLGRRPVAFLLERYAIDARWSLVHATHIDEDERAALARSGAVVVLAPTTEANLGDGIFPLREYLADGGTFAIGSDSNITIDVADELRLLEYVARLQNRRRAIGAGGSRASTGDTSYAAAARGGAQSLGRAARLGALVARAPADIVVLRDDDDAVAATHPLDFHIFASLGRRPSAVMSGGRFRVA